jgi:NAD(P)-dependent dehydrogenase (short-subunit alcohol dehydrogenase family)
VNVVGAVRATQDVLPYMLEKKWGRIVMMASENGPQPDPLQPDKICTDNSRIFPGQGIWLIRDSGKCGFASFYRYAGC